MTSEILTAYVLGVKVAEHVHGVSRKGNQALTDALYQTLQQVASGEITLIDTPEETLAGMPPVPPELGAQVPGLEKWLKEQLSAQVPDSVRNGMRNQRVIAIELLRVLPP